jgi:hypothetical protein
LKKCLSLWVDSCSSCNKAASDSTALAARSSGHRKKDMDGVVVLLL